MTPGRKGAASAGKTAITMCILTAERGSAFYDEVTPVTNHQLRLQGNRRSITLTSRKMLESWYVPFVQLLMSGIAKADAGEVFRDLRFVIFNYDHCIEHYLWLALQSYFDLTREAAAKILLTVEFLHP